jgi:hypothetical protein
MAQIPDEKTEPLTNSSDGARPVMGFGNELKWQGSKLVGRWLRGEQLNFVGEARLDPKLSEMTTGVASKLLKVVGPFCAQKWRYGDTDKD